MNPDHPRARYGPWAYPDNEDIQWFHRVSEEATIKAIVDGTSVPRQWADIQSTWLWCRTKKPPARVRVEKRKTKLSKPNWRMVRILESNGVPYKEAINIALKLLGNRK